MVCPWLTTLTPNPRRTAASTFETFGYTAIEAMACGTPFLGPRAQGYRDTVQHNKGGYLFDAKDITSAAHYLELMIEEKVGSGLGPDLGSGSESGLGWE